MKKIMFSLLMTVLTIDVATAQSKGGVCVWVDSEQPGTVMAGQPGGGITPISEEVVSRIQRLATEDLRKIKSNNVVTSCPQTGENIELDVVVGQFIGKYVASVSSIIQGGKDGPLHVSSNVIAADTEELLALDAVMAYESLKLRIQVGSVKKNK